MSQPLRLSEHLDQFALRLLQDALAEATAAYWLRRAEDFARVGTRECDAIATACRNRASLALVVTDEDAEQLREVYSRALADPEGRNP